MSVKHLGKGSEDVPLQDGLLRFYSMRFCPYAHRIHLVLYAKEIPHDVVNINLHSKPEWYLNKFPAGKVPSLNIDGETLIYESLILADYLDEKYPQRPLLPKDPLRKAQDRILIDEFHKLSRQFLKCYFESKTDPELLALVHNQTDFFEKELAKRGTTFFSGEKPGMVDYMIWPWCERLDIDSVYGAQLDRFERILKWIKEMVEDPAVQKHYCTLEQHEKFLKTYKSGPPDYDNILSTLK